MAGAYSISTIFQGKDRMSPVFNRMSRSAQGFGNIIRKVVGPLAVAFSTRAIARGANESIKLWNVQAAAIANVNATLESTSGTVGRTLSELENQARSMQSNTFFGDESILQGVTAQLLTFTNIQNTAFDRTQKSVLDVTAKLNGLNASEEQLRSTSIALGKALNDPVANLGALSRSGIQFSDAQKAVIKTFAKTNQLAKAQDIILTEIEKQYGGTAAALAQTAGGIEISIKNMIGDTKELIGKGLSPLKLEALSIVRDLLPKLIPGIEKVSTKLNSWLSANKGIIRSKITNFLEKVKIVFQKIGPPIGKIIKSVFKLGGVLIDLLKKIFKPFAREVDGVSSVFEMLAKTITFVSKVINVVAGVIKFLSPVLAPLVAGILAVVLAMKLWVIVQTVINVLLTANPIGLIIVGIGLLVAAIIWLVKHWDLVVASLIKVWNWFSKLLDNPFIAGAALLFAPWLAIPAMIIKHWEPIKAFFTDLWINVIKPIVDGIVNIGGKIGGFFSGVGEGFSNAFEGVKDFFTGEADAPNKREAEAKQEINFQGQLNISGAPEGSSVESTTSGAPQIRTSLAGAM